MVAERENHEQFFKQAAGVVATAYTAAMKGGEIQAFFRQGVAELGSALKAFPDSIQIDEPGQVFNPLYSDISADNRSSPGQDQPAPARLATPAGIAGGQSTGQAEGVGLATGKQPLPSPSDIAKDHQPYRPEPDRGQEHGKDHGRGM